MCLDPLTLFGMAATGIGSVVSGAGAKAEQDQNAANYKAKAAAERRQAAVVQTTGAYQSERKQDEVQRVLGSQRAGYAGSGVALSGTAADVVEESAVEGALDVAAIRYNTKAEADTQRYNAANSEMSAKAAKRAGNIAFITPIISGVAKLGQGFGQTR